MTQTIFVRWGDEMSNGFGTTNGLRQGGIISSYLYNVYINDLSVILNQQKIGCMSGKIMISHLMYADDLILIFTSANGLRRLTNICEEYASAHDIVYNSKKSKILSRRNGNCKGLSYDFEVNSSAIKEYHKVTYLGHILTSDMKDDEDIMRQCRSIYAIGNAMARTFHMCFETVKTKLFKTYFYGLYTYALWWNFTKSSKKKLNVAYNNAFRMLFGLSRDCSASTMFATRGIFSSEAIMRKDIFRFMNRLEYSNNDSVQSGHKYICQEFCFYGIERKILTLSYDREASLPIIPICLISWFHRLSFFPFDNSETLRIS